MYEKTADQNRFKGAINNNQIIKKMFYICN